jgi:peroxiredoxin
LAIVAINVDKKRDAADSFLEQFPAPFPVAFDPAGRTAEAFHVAAMPSTFLVDREGKIALAHRGFRPQDTLEIEKRIEEALAR